MTQKIEETSGIDDSAQLPVVAYHVKYRAGEFLDWSNKWGSDADTKELSYTADAQALLAELREELAHAEQWRDLALQFDRHRMNAMALIKAVAAGKAGTPECAAFAAVPPIPGHAITAEIAEVAELYCPRAYGFEGPETFPDCGTCVVCRAKSIMATDLNPAAADSDVREVSE